MWKQFNNNPVGRVSVGDCVVRAASVALDITWCVKLKRFSLQGRAGEIRLFLFIKFCWKM